jgi:hypothetical protein
MCETVTRKVAQLHDNYVMVVLVVMVMVMVVRR